jgi:hypothetical protein
MQKQEIKNEENTNKRCKWSGRTLKGKYIPDHQLDPIERDWTFGFSIRDGMRYPVLLKGIICGTCYNYDTVEYIKLPMDSRGIPSVEVQHIVHLKRRDDDDE